MSLPNPGMDAVPFTPLTAAFLDNMIANIEALAAGTGLNTNAVTASKLATSALTLGYVQSTSSQSTTSATDVQVTALTTTVTIPSGGRRVKITAFARSLSNNTSGANVHFSIWDGVVGSGTQLAGMYATAPVATGLMGAHCIAVVTPSAGSKTYNVGLSQNGGGTASVQADATHPAFILVEAI